MTVFSYSERVKSPEWRWQRRRADLRHFEIFRHEPIIIYTRLPAEGTYYPICTFPASIECLIGISDAFSLRVSVILPTCSLYPQQKHAYSALHPQAYTGPCPKALTECSPLDFRRSSIVIGGDWNVALNPKIDSNQPSSVYQARSRGDFVVVDFMNSYDFVDVYRTLHKPIKTLESIAGDALTVHKEVG